MCGIVGFFNCGNEHGLTKATNIVSHRGPDDVGIKWFENFNSGLGHRRLSIIDLSASGHQPMAEPNTGLWICYNGEIYNYLEVKEELKRLGHVFKTGSDTEVILKAYMQWEDECLAKFNGMFSFIIYNEKENSAFIVRDRVGIKPLYYYSVNNSLIVASEIKSILESGEYTRAVDYDAILTPIHYQVTPFTGFKNIKKLPPGHFIKFERGKPEIKQYWKINPKEDKSISESEAIEQFDFLLTDSVKLQMTADVPVGVMLSGGLDSSIISALMVKNTDYKINSFTIKFLEKDLKLQGNVDDSFYAKLIARELGFQHNEIVLEPDVVNLLPKMIYHLDEPLADPSAISTYLISKAARDSGIKVLLNGMGGDEIHSGYRNHLACLHGDIYQRFLPKVIRSFLERQSKKIAESNTQKSFKYKRWVKRFLEFASLPQLERYLASANYARTAETFSEYFTNPHLDFYSTIYYKKHRSFFDDNEVSYLTKMCLNDTRIYMPDHNLTYSDKASMAASIESRPPLTDHRMIEFLFKLPTKYRINGLTQKYLLKKVSEKYLSKNIIYRPKAPFSAPLRGWLKNELKDMVYDLLSERRIKNRGVYNYKYVQSLIKDNESGLMDNSSIIFRLMVNELWFKTFFDNQ